MVHYKKYPEHGIVKVIARDGLVEAVRVSGDNSLDLMGYLIGLEQLSEDYRALVDHLELLGTREAKDGATEFYYLREDKYSLVIEDMTLIEALEIKDFEYRELEKLDIPS